MFPLVEGTGGGQLAGAAGASAFVGKGAPSSTCARPCWPLGGPRPPHPDAACCHRRPSSRAARSGGVQSLRCAPSPPDCDAGRRAGPRPRSARSNATATLAGRGDMRPGRRCWSAS